MLQTVSVVGRVSAIALPMSIRIAPEGLGARPLERLERMSPGGRRDHHLTEARRIRERPLARPLAPLSATQARAFSLPAASREPILASWPIATTSPRSPRPTIPVPSTPNLIAPAPISRPGRLPRALAGSRVPSRAFPPLPGRRGFPLSPARLPGRPRRGFRDISRAMGQLPAPECVTCPFPALPRRRQLACGSRGSSGYSQAPPLCADKPRMSARTGASPADSWCPCARRWCPCARRSASSMTAGPSRSHFAPNKPPQYRHEPAHRSRQTHPPDLVAHRRPENGGRGAALQAMAQCWSSSRRRRPSRRFRFAS